MGVNPALSFFEQSRRRDYDTAQNTLIDYDGTHHVRLLKRFEAPHDYAPKSKEAALMRPEYNRVFHLRFYIPKSALISKEQKIRDVVIMFNGLNETDRFDLYDTLGQHLAEQGIAAVLLPTPYHLNRRAPKTKDEAPMKPSDELFKNPMLIYYNCKQSVREGSLLLRKLRQKGRSDPDDLGFYQALFDRRLRISILGFSLGGLRALASFYADPSSYHTCVVFNSGVALEFLHTEPLKIKQEVWQTFLNGLNTAIDKERARQKLNDKYFRQFDTVFLGSHHNSLKKVLKENSQKLLFIVSGADPIVPDELKDIEVEGHGLTVLKIAGVGHIPTLDPQWSPWMNRVSEFIIRFVSSAGRRVWSHQEITDAATDILKGTKYWNNLKMEERSDRFGTGDLQTLLDQLDVKRRADLLRIFYASTAYYPNFRDVLNVVANNKEKAHNKEKVAA